jgi:hypothetical protein
LLTFVARFTQSWVHVVGASAGHVATQAKVPASDVGAQFGAAPVRSHMVVQLPQEGVPSSDEAERSTGQPAPASSHAVKPGKHVYVQRPPTHARPRAATFGRSAQLVVHEPQW